MTKSDLTKAIGEILLSHKWSQTPLDTRIDFIHEWEGDVDAKFQAVLAFNRINKEDTLCNVHVVDPLCPVESEMAM